MMSRGYAFGGEKARRLAGLVNERVKANLAELVSEDMLVMEAGAKLGLSRAQASRAWDAIKADLGPQAQ